MKKFTEVLTVIIFNVCLLLISVIAPALFAASSERFFEKAFDECEMYAVIDSDGIEQRRIIYYVGGNENVAITLSDSQLNEVATHISDYLFDKKDSFALSLDHVYIIGAGLYDDVSLFGDKAIAHMEDVKELISAAKCTLIICTFAAVPLIAFFIARRKRMSKLLFRYSLRFYGAMLFFAVVFVIVALITATAKIPFALRLWKNLHYVIFPFQSKKISASELSDALTCILTTDFFIYALKYVLFFVFLVAALWLISSFLIGRKRQKILS